MFHCEANRYANDYYTYVLLQVTVMDELTTIENKLEKVFNVIKLLKFVYILSSLVDRSVVAFNQYNECDSIKIGILIPEISRYDMVNWLIWCVYCLAVLFVLRAIYIERLIIIMTLPTGTLISLIGHFLNVNLIPCDTIRNFQIFNMLFGINLVLFIQWKDRLVRDLIVRRRRYD